MILQNGPNTLSASVESLHHEHQLALVEELGRLADEHERELELELEFKRKETVVARQNTYKITCGCEWYYDFRDPDESWIDYCPMHTAAPTAIALLEEWLEAWDGYELTAALNLNLRKRAENLISETKPS